jgi:uncharacterized protein
MKVVQAYNATRKTELAKHVRVAKTLLRRSIGLIGTATLPPGEGLWLSPCSSVHMFFMRYPIDVIFLDDQGRVLRAETVRPWRMSRWVRGAQGALELPAGTAQASGTAPGDRIEWRDNAPGR